jgi:hypothetical protein
MSELTHKTDQFSTYNIIMRCLQSEPYAGKEFQDRAFQFLIRCGDELLPDDEIRAGWEKLHEEYERLSEPHWRGVLERIGNRELRQGELF